MRPLFTWLFLATLTFQWVGSYTLPRFEHQVLQENQMNASEEALAGLIRSETGIPVHLRILDPDKWQLQSLGYGDAFVFSKLWQGDTVRFILERTPPRLYNQVCMDEPGQPGHDQLPPAPDLSKPYFSKYCYERSSIQLISPLGAIHNLNSFIAFLSDLYCSAVPVPPPELS